jgi:hypothetical protein
LGNFSNGTSGEHYSGINILPKPINLASLFAALHLASLGQDARAVEDVARLVQNVARLLQNAVPLM